MKLQGQVSQGDRFFVMNPDVFDDGFDKTDLVVGMGSGCLFFLQGMSAAVIPRLTESGLDQQLKGNPA